MEYTKTVWVNGETALNADNMNNIEDGIERAKNSIDTLNSKVGNIESNVSDLESDIDDLASNKQGKIEASGLLKGDGEGGVSAATPNVDYQTPIVIDNVLTKDSENPIASGAVFNELYTNGSETIKSNASEWDDTIIGKYIKYQGNAETSQANSLISDFIEVNVGDKISFHIECYKLAITYATYSSDKTLLNSSNAGLDGSADTWKVRDAEYTVTEGVAYVRFCARRDNSESRPIIPFNEQYYEIVREGVVSKKQDVIDSNGLLKGSGKGNISAAIPGVDYLTPIGLFSFSGEKTSDFSFSVPFRNNTQCMRLFMKARYEGSLPPYISFEIPNFYKSINYEIGVKDAEFEIVYNLLTTQPDDWGSKYTKYYKFVDNTYVKLQNGDPHEWALNTYYSDSGEFRYTSITPYSDFRIHEWRLPPMNSVNDVCNISIVVPSGTTLYVSDFHNYYDDSKPMTSDFGVKINSHLGFRGTDATAENTLQQFELAAKCGYSCAICVPYKTSDGVYVLTHNSNIKDRALDSDGNELTNNVYICDTSYSGILQYNYGGKSKGYFYPQKIATIDEFFELCAKTGMKPMISAHYDDHDYADEKVSDWTKTGTWGDIKDKAQRYNVLKCLHIKSWSDDVLHAAASVMGDSIDGYTKEDGTVNSFSDDVYSGFKCRFVIEAPIIYWVRNRNQAKTLIDNGLHSACYSNTRKIGGSDKRMSSLDFKTLIRLGVNEFTDDYNLSSGLNW